MTYLDPEPGGGLATLAPPAPLPQTTGDHDRMTHIVLEGFKPQDSDFVDVQPTVIESMVNGVPVTALCGKTWVPAQSPRKYAICGTCRDIAVQNGWSVPG